MTACGTGTVSLVNVACSLAFSVIVRVTNDVGKIVEVRGAVGKKADDTTNNGRDVSRGSAEPMVLITSGPACAVPCNVMGASEDGLGTFRTTKDEAADGTITGLG